MVLRAIRFRLLLAAPPRVVAQAFIPTLGSHGSSSTQSRTIVRRDQHRSVRAYVVVANNDTAADAGAVTNVDTPTAANGILGACG